MHMRGCVKEMEQSGTKVVVNAYVCGCENTLAHYLFHLMK